MKLKYADAVAEALEDAPVAVRKAFFKQTKLLGQNLRHPSLRAKKYDEVKIAVRRASTRTALLLHHH